MEDEWRPLENTNYEFSRSGLCKRDGELYTPTIGTHGYYHLWADGRMELLHRIIAKLFIPNPQNKACVDHINRRSLDNRVENLRWATKAENCRNRKLHAKVSDLPRGVQQEGNRERYRAQITYERKYYILGVYDTPEEASEIFETTAELLYGEFYAPPGTLNASLTNA